MTNGIGRSNGREDPNIRNPRNELHTIIIYVSMKKAISHLSRSYNAIKSSIIG
jgi:hypothetical protein